MTSERLGMWVMGLAAVAILLLTIVSSVALTLLAVKRPSAAAGGPNALQRWFAQHEGARSVMVVVLTIMAFLPAFFFRGLKAAGESATGWTRRKLLGTPAPAVRMARSERVAVETRPAPSRSYVEPERVPPSHAPHEEAPPGPPVGVLSGLPVGAPTTTEAAESRPAVVL